MTEADGATGGSVQSVGISILANGVHGAITAEQEWRIKTMAKKMTSKEICNLLENVVGNTEPVADTAIDDVVSENLKTLIDIGDWVLDGLLYAAEHRKDPYYSSKTIGERAYACMLEWKDWLAKKEEELA